MSNSIKSKEDCLRSIYPSTRNTEGEYAWTEKQIYEAMEAYHSQFIEGRGEEVVYVPLTRKGWRFEKGIHFLR